MLNAVWHLHPLDNTHAGHTKSEAISNTFETASLIKLYFAIHRRLYVCFILLKTAIMLPRKPLSKLRFCPGALCIYTS